MGHIKASHRTQQGVECAIVLEMVVAGGLGVDTGQALTTGTVTAGGAAATTDPVVTVNVGNTVKLTVEPAAGIGATPLVPHLNFTVVSKIPEAPAANAPAGAPAEGGETKWISTALPVMVTLATLPGCADNVVSTRQRKCDMSIIAVIRNRSTAVTYFVCKNVSGAGCRITYRYINQQTLRLYACAHQQQAKQSRYTMRGKRIHRFQQCRDPCRHDLYASPKRA